MPYPARGKPSSEVSPPARKFRSGAPSFPSSDELPSGNLVMHPRASDILNLQPAVAPQVLNLQLVDYSLVVSPGRHRHPNRTRSRRPIVAAPVPSPRTRGRHHPRHGGQMICKKITLILKNIFTKQYSRIGTQFMSIDT